MYLFAPSESAQPQPAAKPAIVFFFGGGWTNGSPNQFEQQCRYLASRGMIAITADYRVASRQKVKAVECVKDAKSAIRYVREHASELGIDPNRIAAGGGSAGGHIAACTATIDGFEPAGENPSVSSKPNALVLFNPAVALAELPGMKLTDQQALRAQGLKERMGADPEQLSPAHHITAGLPPTIMFFGTDDALLSGAQQMQAKMKDAGARCELVTYEGQGHGFFNLGRGKNIHFLDTLKRSDEFLQSLGWLSGNEQTSKIKLP